MSCALYKKKLLVFYEKKVITYIIIKNYLISKHFYVLNVLHVKQEINLQFYHIIFTNFIT